MSGLVGFAITLPLVLAPPLFGAYLVAWLIGGSFPAALVATVAGGLSTTAATASTIAFAVVFGCTIRITLRPVLNIGWVAGTLDRRRRYLRGSPQWADVPDSAADLIGWFGPLLGGAVVLGLGVIGWPAADPAVLARLTIGGSVPSDWLGVLLPVGGRAAVGAFATFAGGVIWSVVLGPDDEG